MSKFGRLLLDMKDAKPGDRIYLGISGGLDSAYLAYRLLSDGYRLLLHHTTYRTRQMRYPHEERAYLNVLGWLVDHGFDQFTVTKSEYEVNAGFTPEEMEIIGAQVESHTIYGWNLDFRYLVPEAGKHLHIWKPKNRKAREDIRHVIIASHYESDIDLRKPEYASFVTAAEALAGRKLVWLEPMKAYNRTQILADMPPDLIRLCWWCREPKDGKPCHRCKTCEAVDPALKANGLTV